MTARPAPCATRPVVRTTEDLWTVCGKACFNQIVQLIAQRGKVAQDLEVSENLLHDFTQQMATGMVSSGSYGLEEEDVLALAEDGIECLRDILVDHRRGQV